MTFYPPKVNDRVISTSNVGIAADANAAGMSASFVCGSFASLSLRIDEEGGVIEDARFRTNGCGFMIAAADVLTDWLRSKTVVDLHGLHDSELTRIVNDSLDAMPTERVQCSEVVFEALRSAMAAFRIHRIEEFQGEKALICTCFGVSEETIVSVISENGLHDVDEVAEICRAGSGCGSCRMLIGELIDVQAREGF